jgi:hypothetical protein
MEAASATRLSSENKGESSIRSPGVLLNSIRYYNGSISQIHLNEVMQKRYPMEIGNKQTSMLP